MREIYSPLFGRSPLTLIQKSELNDLINICTFILKNLNLERDNYKVLVLRSADISCMSSIILTIQLKNTHDSERSSKFMTTLIYSPF